MKVVNRQGESVDVSYDEIKKRIARLCDDETLQEIDIDRVVIQTINGIYDGITTCELDELSARICASLQSVHFLYDTLAARIVVSNLSKRARARLGGGPAFASFSSKVAYVGSHAESTLSPAFVAAVAAHAPALDAMVRYERDSTQHSYFALRTLERSYLMRLGGECVESPQDMWMRVAVAIHLVGDGAGRGGRRSGKQEDRDNDKDRRHLARVQACYDSMSTGDYTHATPTLFNAGMRVQQCSSCFDGETQVATLNAGPRRIRDVQVGDVVVTHLGNPRRVTQLHCNALGEREMLRLHVRRSTPLLVTGDHRFWAVRCGGFSPEQRQRAVLEGPAWVRADALVPGEHHVGVPMLTTQEHEHDAIDVMRVLEGECTLRVEEAGGGGFMVVVQEQQEQQCGRDHDQPAVERIWRLDTDFCKLLGMYLACGSVMYGDEDGKQPSGIRFDFGPDAGGASMLAAQAGARTFSVCAHVQGHRHVSFASRIVGTAFCRLFGRRKTELPPLLFSQGSDVATGLLAGIVALQPHPPQEQDQEQEQQRVRLASEGLAGQLYHLLRVHGLDVEASGAALLLPPVGSGSSSGQTERALVVDGRPFLELLSAERPLRLHLQLPRDHVVYTLGVESDHSYAAGGLLAENCYLLGTDDNLAGIFKTLGDCAQISKWAGGIGLHVSNVRSKGARIASTNGTSDGIVPMLKVFNECARYCNQSGRRKGSIAVYLEPWHADVWEFVELRRNTGAETERARDLFLALWVPDEFMRRLEADEDWFLMSPDACPGLVVAVGDAFSTAYTAYVAAGSFVRRVRARALWQHVLQCQLETGTPYILFKDHVNLKCNQNNVGTIRSSNLCAEVTQYSDSHSYAVCNLASIAVNRFIIAPPPADSSSPLAGGLGGGAPHVEHARLHAAAKALVINLNRVIDMNTYPTPETEASNRALRPIGIGLQGLGDAYCMLKLPYDSEAAMRLDSDIMETIYHGALEASAELAELHGPYSRFEGSPASRGQLQMDLWKLTRERLSGRYDWDAMRARVVRSGLRNSLLTALMPTASTSQILGNCESFEPFQANVFKRTTLAGEFVVVNRHLMRDLMALGLWDEHMRRALLASDGSVQALDAVPDELKRVYRTVWELPQRCVIDHAVARGPFVDQSQSMNLYMAKPSFARLSSALVYAWRSGLKTGMYYLRSTAAVEAVKYGIAGGARAATAAAAAATVAGAARKDAAAATAAAAAAAAADITAAAAVTAAGAAAAAAAAAAGLAGSKRASPANSASSDVGGWHAEVDGAQAGAPVAVAAAAGAGAGADADAPAPPAASMCKLRRITTADVDADADADADGADGVCLMCSA